MRLLEEAAADLTAPHCPSDSKTHSASFSFYSTASTALFSLGLNLEKKKDIITEASSVSMKTQHVNKQWLKGDEVHS